LRIAVIAAGSRGDVQPPAGLANALAARGHEARLITSEEFRSLAAPGVKFFPLPVDFRAELQSKQAARMFAGRGNPIAFMRHFLELSRRLARDMLSVCRDASEGCDAILGIGLADVVGVSVAEYWRMPAVHAFLQPLLASRDFPTPLVPPIAMPGWMNRLQYHLLAQPMWLAGRPLANRARREVLGLGPMSLGHPYGLAMAKGETVLMAYSRHLMPPGSDWPQNVHVTGYWFLDAAEKWTPPEGLTRFLDAGPPPVYVGFGSMTLKDPRATLDTVLAAIAEVGCRAVISAGWGGLRAENLPANVFAIDEAPHGWLFPRMAAIVHHGGAGTTGASLRAGKPSVVVPFIFDQPFWAWRLNKVGVAPKAIPIGKLTAERLSNALQDSLGGPMQIRARDLGEKVRAEDGLGAAVAAIERAFRPRA
jgi:UDP:flavonoid glycosyltransferase YjiC (YdhE family)